MKEISNKAQSTKAAAGTHTSIFLFVEHMPISVPTSSLFPYVPSKDNLAEPLSHGELGPLKDKLNFPIKLPDELTRILTDAY